ncbi:hypothetical protein E2562_032846 [Oryza meyeriana var. granulata]|uniref:Uncharacterized protein n=1 Tax=Oryza meyeriana var. granulata TaxID=110450 RepID=A0A6G1DQ22_9ORYZ|nr:hypothetical protein E2562_032846 [Oryza meyeriana var. granulata]
MKEDGARVSARGCGRGAWIGAFLFLLRADGERPPRGPYGVGQGMDGGDVAGMIGGLVAIRVQVGCAAARPPAAMLGCACPGYVTNPNR